jgi:hypothetical protein
MDFLIHATRFDVKAHIWWKGDSVCEKFRFGPLSGMGRKLSSSLSGRMLCKVCAQNAKKVRRFL